MRTTLCTLYNSLYLDKGLVLYDSLKQYASDFELYVLCMDEKCYEVLRDIGEDRLKPIPLKLVENEKMLEAKSNRPFVEYCWTCTSRIIQYILETYNPPVCTYIDADMFFYSDPQNLVNEMLSARKSVMMVPHRFTADMVDSLEKVGTYCVEFNTFKNDAAGLKVLNHWHNKCLECCSILHDGVHWGDQKYMDEWPTLFPEAVHVCADWGAGIAPWNVKLYRMTSNNEVISIPKQTKVNLAFVHYPGIAYFSSNIVNTNILRKTADEKLIRYLYIPYLRRIKQKKRFLKETYKLRLFVRSHPAASGRGLKRAFLSTFVGRWLFCIKKMITRTHYIFYI